MITIAHVLGHLVQHKPNDVSAHTLQGSEGGTHSVAVGLASQGDDDNAVYGGGNLQRFRKTQDRRGVDDDQVVVWDGFFQDTGEAGADEVGGATAGEARRTVARPDSGLIPSLVWTPGRRMSQSISKVLCFCWA